MQKQIRKRNKCEREMGKTVKTSNCTLEENKRANELYLHVIWMPLFSFGQNDDYKEMMCTILRCCCSSLLSTIFSWILLVWLLFFHTIHSWKQFSYSIFIRNHSCAMFFNETFMSNEWWTLWKYLLKFLHHSNSHDDWFKSIQSKKHVELIS